MIQLIRLPGYDINGNPRYVCAYFHLLTEKEKQSPNQYIPSLKITAHYAIAINRSNKIGGRKYHTKSYGGGIVFADYENVIREHIKRIVAEAEQAERDTESNHETY